MDKEKFVDESWKDSVDKEKKDPSSKQDKKIFVGDSFDKGSEDTPSAQATQPQAGQEKEAPGAIEVNFINYMTSLIFQTMVFLGEIPNPMTNKEDVNLPQAKLIIDTLLLLREKTKGNLSKEEENILNGSLYELQLKFVEILNKKEAA